MPLYVIMYPYKMVRLTATLSSYFSSNSTSMMSGPDFLEEEEPLLPREKKSPFGCHTMFPHPAHRTIWFLFPINGLLQAGQFPLMTILFAIAPIRRGPANGSTQVANIRTRNSHPDSANHRKKTVAQLLPIGVSKKSLICFLYLGQLMLKSRVKARHR